MVSFLSYQDLSIHLTTHLTTLYYTPFTKQVLTLLFLDMPHHHTVLWPSFWILVSTDSWNQKGQYKENDHCLPYLSQIWLKSSIIKTSRKKFPVFQRQIDSDNFIFWYFIYCIQNFQLSNYSHSGNNCALNHTHP